MRLLTGPHLPDPGDITDADLAALYPWPAEGRWVRAMMLETLDGSPVGPEGRSKSLSVEADMRVFRTTRYLADAVLIGAETMRAERYTPMRERDGHPRGAPVLVIVSGSLDLPWEEPVWRESHHRPLVLTGPGVDAGALTRAREHADVVVLPATDPSSILAALEDRGLQRITCEGGPRLLADLTRAGLVDEADITLAPLLTGGGQVHAGEAIGPVRLRLAHLLEADGYLIGRYVRV